MLYFFNIQTVIILFSKLLNSRSILCFVILLCINSTFVSGQTDTIKTINKNKQLVIHSSIAGTWVLSEVVLYPLWYQSYNTGNFHFFDDSQEWMHMDKLGHAFTNYQLTQNLYHFYLRNNFSKGRSLLYSSAVGLGYQTSLELFDGFSEGWGFSWSDMLFNSIGCALFTGQDYLFGSQLIRPKFSFFPTDIAAIRPQLLGSNLPEQVFKDYNGQTYWMSVPFSRIVKKSPKWLAISIGYGIMNKIDAHKNMYVTNGVNYEAYRQWYFSLDIHPKEITYKRKWVKRSLFIFNYIKFPFPSIGYSQGKMHFYPIHF